MGAYIFLSSGNPTKEPEYCVACVITVCFVDPLSEELPHRYEYGVGACVAENVPPPSILRSVSCLGIVPVPDTVASVS